MATRKVVVPETMTIGTGFITLHQLLTAASTARNPAKVKEYISRARTILFDLDEAIVDESLREFTWIGDNE